MAAFTKFYSLTEKLAQGVFNCATDDLKVYLTNNTPDPAGDINAGDLPEIAAVNGYDAGGKSTANSVTTSLGVASVVAGTDVTWTATGPMGPFQYVVLYDDTVPGNPLIGYWAYPGGSITLQAGETFTVDFGTSMFTIT